MTFLFFFSASSPHLFCFFSEGKQTLDGSTFFFNPVLLPSPRPSLSKVFFRVESSFLFHPRRFPLFALMERSSGFSPTGTWIFFFSDPVFLPPAYAEDGPFLGAITLAGFPFSSLWFPAHRGCVLFFPGQSLEVPPRSVWTRFPPFFPDAEGGFLKGKASEGPLLTTPKKKGCCSGSFRTRVAVSM